MRQQQKIAEISYKCDEQIKSFNKYLKTSPTRNPYSLQIDSQSNVS